jgi:hypothetical protein
MIATLPSPSFGMLFTLLTLGRLLYGILRVRTQAGGVRRHGGHTMNRLLKYGVDALKPHFVDGRWRRPLISKRNVSMS